MPYPICTAGEGSVHLSAFVHPGINYLQEGAVNDGSLTDADALSVGLAKVSVTEGVEECVAGLHYG
jgi:hypothetical protein